MADGKLPRELIEKLGEKFVIQGYLGNGGGGVVLKAQDRNNGRDVAIKVLRSTLKSDARKLLEVGVLATLDNEHLPRVYLYDEACGYSYMVMEYIRGKTLRMMMAEGHVFSAEETLSIAKQLAGAVGYLHEQTNQIIHGDIKPDNIIMDSDGKIVLIDLNISGIREDDEDIARTFGFTSGFSAPEQAEAVRNIKASMALKKNFESVPGTEVTVTGTDHLMLNADATGGDPGTVPPEDLEIRLDRGIPIDSRSDVYSIGATLYYIYFGSCYEGQAFEDDDTGLGRGFGHILQHALEDDPDMRFYDACEMEEALSRVHLSDREYKVSNILFNLGRIFLLLLTVTGVLLIIYGVPMVEREKQADYNSCLDRMGMARDAGDRLSFISPYEDALELFPHRAEAYCQYASFLYESGDYAGAVEYINKDALTVSSLSPEEYVAELYYVLGNSYYELQDYPNAVIALSEAVDRFDDRPEYYADLAHAYMGCGDTEKASDIVEQAEANGAVNGDLLFLKGQIQISLERYRAAFDAFNECIDSTGDTSLKMRAYVEGSRALTYLGPGFYEENAAFLETGLATIPAPDNALLLEQLAQISIDAYDNSGEDDCRVRAQNALLTIIAQGGDNEVTYSSLAVLYEQGGEFDRVSEILEQMRTRYPESYMTYKRLAFFEADMQSQVPEQERNYGRFEEYYDEAERLFALNREGRENDPEMNTLRELHMRLADGGWLSGEEG